MALVVADLYVGLTMVRSKIGFLIGSATGLLVIISYAGFTIGFAAALLMAFATKGSGIVRWSGFSLFCNTSPR